MEEGTEGRRTNEKWENQENDSLVINKNDSLLDELQTLLIQKECELICLRSELEIHNNLCSKKQEGDQENSNSEDDSQSIQHIEGFGDVSIESQEPKNSFSKMLSFFTKNSFPFITKQETQETQDQYLNESEKRGMHQAMTQILNEVTVKIQAQRSEEKLEMERQKKILLVKELQIQRERDELEYKKSQIEEEKKMLEKNKYKIETELRNLLDDENRWSMEEEGACSENSGEQVLICNRESTHSDPSVAITEKDDPTLSNEVGENAIEKESNIQIYDNLAEEDNELLQLAEAKAEKIITEQEEKLRELEQFIDTWKKIVVDEREIMNHRIENREGIGYKIRESCCLAIKNISKEWREIKEAYKKIQMHHIKLTELEKEITEKKIELEKKENLNKEDLVEIENGKKSIQTEWNNINLEKEQLKSERTSLEKEKQTLNESRESIERQRQMLEKAQEEYREEMRIEEEIHREVEEKRTMVIIEEQRNLEGKRESLLTERHDLYKARQRCDAHRAFLDWERTCLGREKEAIKGQWTEIKKEKLALEIIKAVNDENMIMIEKAWKEIKAKECDIENALEALEKERKYINDERIALQNDKSQIEELKIAVLKRVTEMNMEVNEVEQKKNELLAITTMLDKKKSELDTEWEALKIEKEECKKISEGKNGISQTLMQDLKLTHIELLRSLKNKLITLVEDVICMEECSSDEATNCIRNEKFHPQQNFYISCTQMDGMNGVRKNENDVNKRIKHLIKTVKSMETDMHKMRLKINKKRRLRARVISLKKQVKMMQSQISSLQENLKHRNEINFNAFEVMKKYMHPFQENLITRKNNYTYDAYETITRTKNVMTDTVSEMAGDWKRTYVLQDKYCLKCLKSIQIVKSQDNEHLYNGNEDYGKGEATHKMGTITDIDEEQSKFKHLVPCEEITDSSIKCLKKNIKGHMNRIVHINKQEPPSEDIESEMRSSSHLFPPTNMPWGKSHEADSNNEPRSAWNLAFIIAIVISCGATSVLISTS